MILENWLKELNKLFKNTYINNTKERKALEHILLDYKRVLEMNEVLLKENEKLKKNYTNIQESSNITFYKVIPPPEPQLPTKTLCESFSKKGRK